MEKRSLRSWLEAGLSLGQISELTGRDPSTVGYWVKKHGLTANGKGRYAPKGGIDREKLERLAGAGGTLASIGAELDISASTVRYWLNRYGLSTTRKHRRQRARQAQANGQKKFVDHCPRHGFVEFGIYHDGRSRCLRCSNDAVSRRRRKVKSELIDEAGGRCIVCGYDRDPSALQFHHLDRGKKEFGIASGGCTRSIERARAEAAKCVLLCANCHAEVESGTTALTISSHGS